MINKLLFNLNKFGTNVRVNYFAEKKVVLNSTHIYIPDKFPINIIVKYIWKIENYWTNTIHETIIPKGTSEIIFNLTAQTTCYRDSPQTGFTFFPININGINTQPYHLINHQYQEFIGIQLYPFAFNYLFNIAAHEFTNQVINGLDLHNSFYSLYHKLIETKNFNQQTHIIMQWLNERLSENEIQNRTKKLVRSAELYKTKIDTVSAMSKHVNLSKRQLQRISNDFIGLPLEDFILYKKYIHALQSIHYDKTPLVVCAVESGFYDQSHFIRTFKDFTGLTPGEYKKQMTTNMGHLFKTDMQMST